MQQLKVCYNATIKGLLHEESRHNAAADDCNKKTKSRERNNQHHMRDR
jgi:hypothetical protein